MIPDFSLKSGDTSPALKYQCQNENGVPVDITRANQVKFLMENSGNEKVIDEDTSGPVSVVDSSQGIVQYDWREIDTAQAGSFRAEFEIEYSDGEKETFPNGDGQYIRVKITEDIG